MVLGALEAAAREAKKASWTDPQLGPPWEWGEREESDNAPPNALGHRPSAPETRTVAPICLSA